MYVYIYIHIQTHIYIWNGILTTYKKMKYCHLQQYGYTRERQILDHLIVESKKWYK